MMWTLSSGESALRSTAATTQRLVTLRTRVTAAVAEALHAGPLGELERREIGQRTFPSAQHDAVVVDAWRRVHGMLGPGRVEVVTPR